MDESKSLFLSKTFWGVVVGVAAELTKKYGITLDQAGLTNDLVALAASAFAVYGRVAATQAVHILSTPAKPGGPDAKP